MRKHFVLLVSTALFIFTTTAFSQVKIILDTDFEGDADDLGALAMVHNFIDRGERNFSQNAPWMKANFKGRILDNSTYDQTAVLYAVRKGLGTYWDKVTGGYCVPDEIGGNKWVKGRKRNHSYLKLKMKPEEMATMIESIMLNNF